MPTRVPLKACPVTESLGVLGRRYALALLRDVAWFDLHRFSDFLDNNRGLTRRTLSQRLRELVDEGFLERRRDGRDVRYVLTPKGDDVQPLLLALFRFGIRHHADAVFHDATPRERLPDVVPAFDAAYVTRAFGP